MPTFSGPGALVSDSAAGTGKFVISAVVEEALVGDVVMGTFRVEIPNPGSGSLLSGGRVGSISDDGMTIATGRMLGAPVDIGGDTITLEFVCVPDDEDEVLRAEADSWRLGEVPEESMLSEESLRYDPLFYPRDSDDPMDVLAATTLYWRWDMRNNNLDTVDFRWTGGANHTIGGDDGIDGSLRFSPLDPPKPRMKIRLLASWTQEARGIQSIPIWGEVSTYTFDDLLANWPAPGTPVGQGSGWHIAESEIVRVSPSLIPDAFDVGPEFHNNDPDVLAAQVMLQSRTIEYNLRLGYEYSQQREEIVDISMSADMQSVIGGDRQETTEHIPLAPLTEDLMTPAWSYDDPETLVRKHYGVGDMVQANGRVWRAIKAHDATPTFRMWDWQEPNVNEQLWATDARVSAMQPSGVRFFDTPRGSRAIRHAIRRMQRVMLQRAHCFEVSCATTWTKGKSIRVGHIIRVEHPHIPGGAATGWCSAVRHVFEESGEARTEVTVLVPAGMSTGSGTEPEYTLDGQRPSVPVNVAGLHNRLPRVVDFENVESEQRTAARLKADPVSVIEEMPTRMRIGVWPLSQSDTLTRRLKVDCEPLSVRRGINL